MKTGNTPQHLVEVVPEKLPQWSPVMKTGNTCREDHARSAVRGASMEPGHEDREYVAGGRLRDAEGGASMEPGHEDREYSGRGQYRKQFAEASMEPGHEDREYPVVAEPAYSL